MLTSIYRSWDVHALKSEVNIVEKKESCFLTVLMLDWNFRLMCSVVFLDSWQVYQTNYRDNVFLGDWEEFYLFFSSWGWWMVDKQGYFSNKFSIAFIKDSFHSVKIVDALLIVFLPSILNLLSCMTVHVWSNPYSYSIIALKWLKGFFIIFLLQLYF